MPDGRPPAMNGKAAYTIVPPTPNVRAVQDEWGMFDPNQAGLEAAFRAVQAIDDGIAEPVSNGDSADELPVFGAEPTISRAAPKKTGSRRFCSSRPWSRAAGHRRHRAASGRSPTRSRPTRTSTI